VTTEHGFAGLAGEGYQVRCLVLPQPTPEACLHLLEVNLTEPLAENRNLLPVLTEQLKSYFAGIRIDRWECEPDLSSYPDFHRRVYQAARRIPYGTVFTYGDVARSIDCPKGAQAVGQALKRNPVPLVIPCHRVVSTRGLGGFTAPGGLETKKFLLRLEGCRL